LPTQSAQNVHSNVQMHASSAPFGRSRSHISQFGRISSIGHLQIAVEMMRGAEVKGAPSVYEFTQGGTLVFNY